MKMKMNTVMEEKAEVEVEVDEDREAKKDAWAHCITGGQLFA